MRTQVCTFALNYDYDLVEARRRARQVAAAFGFGEQDQTRLSTVVSEIARNSLRYASGGSIEFAIDTGEEGDFLVTTVTDRGKGIDNLEDVLSGRYVSATGMGIGINGARRLVDDFDISTGESGTRVVMKKRLKGGALAQRRIERIAEDLSRQRPENPLEEIQVQNRELLQTLASLSERQEELERLNRELEDTNRGVLALYAELDEKADSIRRNEQLKSRFFADMSHEFRTPVNSILALTRLLDEGELSEEGRKQVALIRRSAEDLESLVNDLLDLSKIEAGKAEINAVDFEVANLFSALRGMLRPLLLNRSVSLVFDDATELPPMHSDESKIAQILRNFISNALKYTEAGEIRVSASGAAGGESIVFSVSDTGIGIAPEDQDRIFDEFTQIPNPLQARKKGTGLGLPLTRKLARLLGGSVWVNSQPGLGSTFCAEIPLHAGQPAERKRKGEIERASSGRPLTILIIDDDETARYTMASFASGPDRKLVEAQNGVEGIARAQGDGPDIIFLDMMMPGIGGHEVLHRLKNDPGTAAIPVVVVTSRFVNDEERRQILSKAAAVVYKRDLSREIVTAAIDDALGS